MVEVATIRGNTLETVGKVGKHGLDINGTANKL